MKNQIENNASKSQIPGLNGLRGIAILGVVGYHLTPNIFPGGFLGVNLFFVLSGYLMAITSRREQKHSGFQIGRFYWKRAVRIYPALIISVCAVLCAALFFTPDVLPGIRSEALSIFSGSNNWWQIEKNTSYFTRITGTSPLTHLWSLAIEMQFYLVWPLLFWGYRVFERRKKQGSVLFMILIFISVLALFLLFRPGEDPSRVYYGTDTRIFALLIGGLMGMSRRAHYTRLKNDKLLYGIIFLLLFTVQIGIFFTVDGENPLTYWLVLIPSAWLGAALIDLCANKRLAFGRCLDCLPFSWIGKRSYEIYLVQYPIIFFVQRVQPGSSQIYNFIAALILILLFAQWIYWSTIKIKYKNTVQKWGIL